MPKQLIIDGTTACHPGRYAARIVGAGAMAIPHGDPGPRGSGGSIWFLGPGSSLRFGRDDNIGFAGTSGP
jgi:hypothetical protein